MSLSIEEKIGKNFLNSTTRNISFSIATLLLLLITTHQITHRTIPI